MASRVTLNCALCGASFQKYLCQMKGASGWARYCSKSCFLRRRPKLSDAELRANDSKRARLYRQRHPEKVKAVLRAYYAKHRERLIANAGRLYLLSERGQRAAAKPKRLSKKAYIEAGIAAQDGLCAVCGSALNWGSRKTIPCLDHDHHTRARRGILCHRCNCALGLLRESETIIRGALAYIQKWDAAQRKAAV